MSHSLNKSGIVVGSAVLLLASGGCVERTLKITTNPPGARVYLNDEEIGISPVKTAFLWYGDYDIVVRKAGYETVKTNHRINAPWHQIPPIDLITECFIPGTIHDDHEFPTIELTPETVKPASELVDRAVELRDRTLYEGN